MRDDIVDQLKYVLRKRLNLPRITSICVGDKGMAKAVAIRALRELAEELETNGEGVTVEWDPVRKIPVMKKRN